MILVEEKVDSSVSEGQPRSLGRVLFSGSSALGVATLLERGLGFIANLAAARLGGTHVFGAYSVAMTTATNVASYAGAGIGTTANRFSGEYPYGSPGYRGLLRTLAVVSLGSGALAVAILWFAAPVLAVHLIRNPALTSLLRLAAISAGAIILLECLRGLLIGQRRYTALLALSVLFGGGMAITLPWMARKGPSPMVLSQAVIALSSIAICLVAARKLKFQPVAVAVKTTKGPSALSIVRFGMVQLAGLIGINAAGWWIASLVARSDISLAQAGWYSVAAQMRNICAMPAGLISQTAYAQLSENGAQDYGGASRVTLLSTMAATLISLAIAGPAAALMPWIISTLYGHDFAGAGWAATLAVATGLVHMSAAPAAARLTVVSLPMTGIINGAWSVVLVGLGSGVISHGGAAEATACFLAAHLLAALAVLVVLIRTKSAPRELIVVTFPSMAGALLIAVMGWWRAQGIHPIELSVGILAANGALFWIAFQHGCKTSVAIRSFSIAKLWSGLVARSRMGPGRSSVEKHDA